MISNSRSVLVASISLLLTSPALAQDLGERPPATGSVDRAAIGASTSQPAQGLDITITDESEWRDLSIAIPSFATDRDQPTPANAQGTAALGRAIGQVVYNNLKNNGLFRPVGPDALPQTGFEQVQAPSYTTWNSRGTEMLIQGFVKAGADNKLTIGCYLYDVALRQEVAREGWVVQPNEWRRAAHKCADLIYSKLTGENPFFDSRIAYIAETGPKNKRVKRLAIMDSDGANHRFITQGRTTALTPRFSPDYSQLLYLSYVDGNPRIYVYDIGTGRQRLVVENKNPTIAPRWSPDGKHILFSMAVAGNTDIYRVSVSGGSVQRLTDTPGIDIGGSYSPDGSKIVFESDRSGSQQVYVMNADGSGQKRISFHGGRAATPEWSPRGDQIAFTHIAGDFRIAIMSPEGRNLRHLTNSWQDEAPTWAPNGRIVQFFRTEKGSGRTGLWQVDLTGRNERRLQTPVDGSDPAWGPILP
jgi:TolB protein